MWIPIIIILYLAYTYVIKYHHKNIYYFYLKQISNRINIYKGKYFVDNFDKIIKPYFLGDIDYINNSINIDRTSKNQYAILKNKLDKNMINELKKTNVSNNTIDKLIKIILNNVHLNGKNINIDDLIYVDLLNVSGNYFPFFHTDVQWSTFEENNGFQIWILLEKDKKIHPRGNMFILETDDVDSSKIISIKKNNIKIIENGGGFFSEKVVQKINSLSDLKPKIKYLNCDIGDIFLMNPLVYHCSDPFIKFSNRTAINIRVLHKPKKKLNIFDINNGYTNLLLQKHTFKKKQNGYYLNNDNYHIKYKFL